MEDSAGCEGCEGLCEDLYLSCNLPLPSFYLSTTLLLLPTSISILSGLPPAQISRMGYTNPVSHPGTEEFIDQGEED
jgi:hypothetical protein